MADGEKTPLGAGEEGSASDKSKGMVQTGFREAHRRPRPISGVQILFLPLATKEALASHPTPPGLGWLLCQMGVLTAPASF